VRVRVIPEKSRALPAMTGNTHLIVKLRARVNVNKYIVAVALRRDAHSVIVQVRWIILELVTKSDAYRVAKAHPQHRGDIGIVVEKAGEGELAELHETRRRGERCVEHTILAAYFPRLSQGLAV
jgi:hypothetical protein